MTNQVKLLFIFFIVLFFGSPVNAAPLVSIRSSTAQQSQQTIQQSEHYNAQAQIEEAAEQFDSFALLMPQVLNAKLQSFLKHGFKAFLLEDPETKPAEEQMIGALTKGLKALGDSLSEDLANNIPHQEQATQLPPKHSTR